MIDSIFVALSGMLGHQRGLNVISNNVANLNTPGFRGSTVDFADLFSGTTQNNTQNDQFAGQQALGGGLDSTRTRIDLRPGAQQHTGRGLDLFLQGDGFFVLQDENGATRYTRAGGFEFNNDGELIASGQKLKVMTRNAAGELVPVVLKDLKISPPKTTTEVTFDGDLSPEGADHTIDSLVIFDKQGAKHTLRVVFSKDTTAQTDGVTVKWKVTVSEGTQAIGSGDLTFIATQLQAGSSPLKMTLTLPGADPIEVAFNFTAVTGFSLGAPNSGSTTTDSSTVAINKQDGFAPGTITANTFDAQGVLKLTYSNGQTAAGPKLVLAEISDVSALVEVGKSLFAYRGSQPVTFRAAGDDLVVLPQTLEASNVDLTQEFSELILMQRGYQASSQVLSTANDMLQELFGIKGRK